MTSQTALATAALGLVLGGLVAAGVLGQQATRSGAACDPAWPYSHQEALHGPLQGNRVSDYPVAAPPRPGAW